MTIPYRENIEALERFLIENGSWDSSNREEGISRHLESIFSESESEELVSASQICSSNSKKKEAIAQEVSNNTNYQSGWFFEHVIFEEQGEQNKFELDETFLKLYVDYEEVVKTMPFLAEEHEFNKETISFPLEVNEASDWQKAVDEILVRYIDNLDIPEAELHRIINLISPFVENIDEFVLKRLEEMRELQNECNKASCSIYNFPAASECDAVAPFKKESESERQSEIMPPQNAKHKSKRKGTKRRKCYNKNNREIEKKRTLLKANEKKRRDELKKLMINLQMCVPKIADAPKHVSQARVLIEAKKLIETSQSHMEGLLKEIAVLKKENQKLLIKYEKLNSKSCTNE